MEPVPVSTLFDPDPGSWGARGDLWTWRDMKQRLSAVPCPATTDELAAILRAEFEGLTGHPITHGDGIYLERYDNGGMSGGMVWPPFWRDTALPLLMKRLAEASG